MKSTAGAGVASILMDETAILNPAPIAFFNETSFYLQKLSTTSHKAQVTNSDEGTNSNSEVIPLKSDSYGVILSDGKNQLKGSLSLQKQQEFGRERERISVAGGMPAGQLSSFGILYRWTKDSNIEGPKEEDKYHQLTVGAIHAINENLSFGAIIVDPLGIKKDDMNAVLGTQYLFEKIISFMVDIGGNYDKDLTETFFYKAATQLNFFDDFYVRVGTFKDKGLNEKGNGMGVSWLTPKLLIELAYKNTKPLESDITKTSSTYLVNKPKYESMKDVSLSFSYRF
jgi:hypothetical protein